jgi:hypothetical protein
LAAWSRYQSEQETGNDVQIWVQCQSHLLSVVCRRADFDLSCGHLYKYSQLGLIPECATDNWYAREARRGFRNRAGISPYLGGPYGSGVPALIGGYFFKLCSKSMRIFVIGTPTHEFVAPTSRSSFRSVRRLTIFGSGSVIGRSYMFTCQMRCIFQLCHLTAERRSAT